MNQLLEQRLRQLSALPNGWLDGEGLALPAGSIDWLIDGFASLSFNIRPGLSPTPEGNITAEWSHGPWEASADIDLHVRVVRWHALSVENPDEETEEEFAVNSDADWGHLRNLANAI